MGQWILLPNDDGTFTDKYGFEEDDRNPAPVKRVSELQADIAAIEKRIKSEPDIEAMEYWNQMHGDSVAMKELEVLKNMLKEILATGV